MNGLYITARVRKMLQVLLQAYEGITVKEIAATLDVSERTIHRDLKELEDLAKEFQLNLVKRAGVGLSLEGKKEDKDRLNRELVQTAELDLSSDERQAVILSILFEAQEPIKLYALSSELRVTTATVRNDLDQLEVELERYNLQLIRKRGSGVQITGKEANKRAAISNLISQYVEPYDFISLIKQNIQKKSAIQTDKISNRLLGLVDPDKLHAIEGRVEQARHELPNDLADSAYVGLVVHLALAMERLNRGEKIRFDPTSWKQLQGTREFAIAKKMLLDLEVSLNMDIPEDEIGYITMHLLGAKLRADQNYLIEDTSMDIAYKAKALIDHVGNQLDVDLTKNAVMLNDLVAHLKPTMYRLKQEMNIKNPLLKEIMDDYRDLFDVVRAGVLEVFPDTPFPDDEIGYLVLHFAAILLHDDTKTDLQALVICSSGIGTAKMLATTLQQRIPEIRHVDNKSMFDLQDMPVGGYDIIVSTIPLQGFEGEYVLASPILTKQEVHRIKKAIRQKKLTVSSKQRKRQEQDVKTSSASAETFTGKLRKVEVYSRVMLQILDHFSVKKITNERTTKDMLHIVCTELAQEGLLSEPDYVFQKLVEREKLSGLGIPDTTLGLYHTRSNGVNRPSFTIHHLEHAVTIKGMDDQEMQMTTILLMLAPEAAEQETLEVMSLLSGLIIQGRERIQLFESGEEAAIKQLFIEEFQNLLHKNNLL
ncbi:BglG family transcription antiterminator [Oceanobacillus manasiensis]|uniref:BglG family transcription antiterminator n=1 Tax=Oceanobacillus manasiensis TaxID=586413 RepID=UPI001E35D720|nr:BglG family transcription antiterminator [Oceanobacillus manasiensis]